MKCRPDINEEILNVQADHVDIHTHILPNMDDGASSAEESLQLLGALSRQGVTAAAATPHFYADREHPSEFFARRQNSLSLLMNQLDFPITILSGAEVCYYPGISRTERLPEFAIGSTKLLLLEMPFYDWTASVVDEVLSIQRDRDLKAIVAHIDRYFGTKSIKYMEELRQNGILFQINASAFLDRRRRNEALRLLRDQTAQFVASDCHNMDSRPPRLDEAFAVIEKKLGSEYLQKLKENSEIYFGRR